MISMKHPETANLCPEPATVSGPGNSMASQPKTDLWSAAGNILALQNRLPRLARSQSEGLAPLSFAQERLWMLEQSEPGTSCYNVPLTWEITGELNVPDLERSLDFLFQRHEVLRATFPETPAGPVQEVKERRLSLAFVDLLAQPGLDCRAEAARQANQFARTPFNLRDGPLFRAALYRRGPQDHWLVVVVHQMVFDGASMRVFSRDLAECYRAYGEKREPNLPAVPFRYSDFAQWQRECLSDELLGSANEFWRAQLRKPYEPLRLTLDHPRRNAGIIPASQVPIALPAELMDGLKGLAHNLAVTPFAAVLGSFQAFLGRCTGQEDVLTLVSVAARNQSEVRNIVGLVANVLPMRLDLSGSPGLNKVLERAGQVISAALTHQLLPLGAILENLPSSGANTTAPALQVLVIYNNAPLPTLRLHGATFTPSLDLHNGTTKFDLLLEVADSPQGVTGHLRYRSDVFEPATIQGLIRNWLLFIREGIAHPEQPIHSFALSFAPTRSHAEGLTHELADYTFPPTRTGSTNLPVGDSNGRSAPTPPRNEFERKLAGIWEKIFDIRPIGIHDNFFGLGGHSLVAVKLIAAIEKETGRKLRLRTIFKEPTIARLAQAMQDGEQTASASSIIEIQPKGTKPPLFLVHGVGGGMFWGYSNLARELGLDQPVYAFKSRGMDGLKEFTRIEEMAAQYVADLRQFQPTGPYHLGGYCFGGNVAYEMARQLTAQNQKVALLLLFNCWPNNSSYTRLTLTPAFFVKAIWNFCLRLEHQIRCGAKKPRDFFKWRAAWASKRLKSFFTSRMEDRLAVDDIVDLSSRPQHERDLWRTHVQAWLQYQPQPYDGQIVLFRTRGHPLVCSFDHQMGWGSFAAKGVLVRTLPGDHESILEEENVACTARELRLVLGEIEKPNGHSLALETPGKAGPEPFQLAAPTPSTPLALPSARLSELRLGPGPGLGK